VKSARLERFCALLEPKPVEIGLFSTKNQGDFAL
jgi:hypothetical protein